VNNTISPNLDLGLKYLGIHNKTPDDYNVTAIFACSVRLSTTEASILAVNLTKFIDMREAGEIYRFDEPNIEVLYSIYFREDLSYYISILDFYMMY
jgi:predicted CDP-diglyceride synthetase/phosphatidate cytidylyltransferase